MSEQDLAPEVEAIVNERVEAALKERPELTHDTATKFIKSSGGHVYLSDKAYQDSITDSLGKISRGEVETPNETEKSIMSFLKQSKAATLGAVDNALAESGIEKPEGALTKDYARLVLEELKKGEIKGINPAEHSALKSKLQEFEKTATTWEQKYKEKEVEIFNTEKAAKIAKGIPIDKMDYPKAELDFLLPGLEARIHAKYDFVKEDGKWHVVNKQTGNIELDKDHNRKDPSETVTDFIMGLDLKFKEQKPNGAALPGANGQVSTEQLESVEKDWKDALRKKGLIGNEREAHLMRKEMGLPISEATRRRWPNDFKE